MSNKYPSSPFLPFQSFKITEKQISFLINKILGCRSIPFKNQYDWLSQNFGHKDHSDLTYSYYFRSTTNSSNVLIIFSKNSEKIIDTYCPNFPDVSKKYLCYSATLMAINAKPEYKPSLSILINSWLRYSSIVDIVKPNKNRSINI